MWRTIDTAPHQKQILLWAKVNQEWEPDNWHMATGYFRIADNQWIWDSRHAPTHWQPLPEPPTA